MKPRSFRLFPLLHELTRTTACGSFNWRLSCPSLCHVQETLTSFSTARHRLIMSSNHCCCYAVQKYPSSSPLSSTRILYSHSIFFLCFQNDDATTKSSLQQPTVMPPPSKPLLAASMPSHILNSQLSHIILSGSASQAQHCSWSCDQVDSASSSVSTKNLDLVEESRTLSMHPPRFRHRPASECGPPAGLCVRLLSFVAQD